MPLPAMSIARGHWANPGIAHGLPRAKAACQWWKACLNVIKYPTLWARPQHIVCRNGSITKQARAAGAGAPEFPPRAAFTAADAGAAGAGVCESLSGSRKV